MRSGQVPLEEGQGQGPLGLGPSAALPSTDFPPRGNCLGCELRLVNDGWESAVAGWAALASHGRVCVSGHLNALLPWLPDPAITSHPTTSESKPHAPLPGRCCLCSALLQEGDSGAQEDITELRRRSQGSC